MTEQEEWHQCGLPMANDRIYWPIDDRDIGVFEKDDLIERYGQTYANPDAIRKAISEDSLPSRLNWFGEKEDWSAYKTGWWPDSTNED